VVAAIVKVVGLVEMLGLRCVEAVLWVHCGREGVTWVFVVVIGIPGREGRLVRFR
jgi:hypothetical protein